MKLLERIKKEAGMVLCVLLSAVLVTASFSANGLTVIASGLERTFDIGVNPESVTATLSEDGVLTVKGSGAIRDFTENTAPFADCKIKTVKLGADITAVGDYTFYNCGELTGTLVLPKGLLRIGSCAFSGSSEALAPKPASVENSFTESLVTRRKTLKIVESASRSELAEEEPVESAPAESESGDGDPEENGSADSEPEDSDSESSEEESSASSPADSSTAPSQEQTETKYIIERIVQQEIGEEIFFPRADGPAFLCSAENETFRAAMLAAGYREAGTLLSVTFHCGEGSSTEGDALAKNLPVLDGRIVLPDVPAEFSAPAGNGLYRYAFRGWTESKDAAGTVRAAGSGFDLGDRTDLYFIANWKRELTAEIAVQEDGSVRVFTVPALEGYDTLTYRWQTCTLAAGEEIPSDEETLPWEDIPNGTAQSYRWDIVPTDTEKLFRCVVTVQKQQNFLQALFGTEEEQEAAFAAVKALPDETKDTGMSQGTAIIRGRSFLGSISGAHPTIGTGGAVTASFVSQYAPTGKDNTRLLLCKKDGETFVKANFPAGTKLVLGDMTAGACRYYSYTVGSASAEIPLTGFAAVSGAAKYASPAASEKNMTEKLLIVADFSGGELPQGEYGLAVLHSAEEKPDTAQKATFAVTAASGSSLGLTLQESDSMTWSITVSPAVSGIDSRYAAGACIRLWLTDPDGQNQIALPSEMPVTGSGAENLLPEQDGSLTFTMPANGAASLSLQLSGLQESVLPNGEYQLHASLAPRAGLQMSSRQGQIDAAAAVDVSLTRSAGEGGEKRNLSISLDDDSQRLLDVSEGTAAMDLTLSYAGIQERDTLQTEVLCKTGADPDDSSYSPASGDWDISPVSVSAPSGTTEIRLTVPQGQSPGTYCLRVSIADHSGSIVAKELYYFIVE
ncbi:MAG: leucine-rich repeat protein [Acutalibacter sp.]|nr:leucine-rich repeat protein [Acutalibacter sp.]